MIILFCRHGYRIISWIGHCGSFQIIMTLSSFPWIFLQSERSSRMELIPTWSNLRSVIMNAECLSFSVDYLSPDFFLPKCSPKLLYLYIYLSCSTLVIPFQPRNCSLTNSMNIWNSMSIKIQFFLNLLFCLSFMHSATEPLFSFLFDFHVNLVFAYLFSFSFAEQHLSQPFNLVLTWSQLSVSVSLSCQNIFCHSENETIAANVFAL